ncbi:hypothetical protein ACFPES_09880 [Paenibacillus sp. GCM10023248]|uniref:hypothetical protein n=1 Tax=Bacillales TaxID=1385 RepID=UPI0023788550|nr:MULTISPECIES: hypothetical protein [Bacillales]MDD9267329.1 hypothetical protein [Paenibacillus sp. MAHUQ-63]MDR6884829.1 uncharacterized protein (DUF433 family) [Bacillus sp. 3255]
MGQLLQKLEEMLKQLPGGVTEGPVGNVLQRLGQLQATMDEQLSGTDSELVSRIQAEIGKLNLGDNTWTEVQNVLNQVSGLLGQNFLTDGTLSGLLQTVQQLVTQIAANPTPENITANLPAIRALLQQIEAFLTAQLGSLNQESIVALLRRLKVIN